MRNEPEALPSTERAEWMERMDERSEWIEGVYGRKDWQKEGVEGKNG